MKCKYCNGNIQEGEDFCPSCGKKVKKSNKTFLWIILLVVFLGCGLAGGYFYGKSKQEKCVCEEKECPKEDNNTSYDNVTNNEKYTHEIDFKNTSVKVTYEGDYVAIESVKSLYDAKYHQVNLLFKNNEKEDFEFTAYLNFLDSTGTRVDRSIDSGKVGAGKYFVVQLSNSSSDDYESVSVTIKTKKIPSYLNKVNVKDKDYEVIKTNEEIDVNYKNNTKNTFSLYFTNIYYKNNEIVYFDRSTIISVTPGNTGKAKFYYTRIPGYVYGADTSTMFDKNVLELNYAYYANDEY